MSFSTAVKNEISRIMPEKSCCKKAELSGLIRVGGSITIASNMQMALEMRTENAAVARKFLTLAKSAYGIETEISVLRKNRLKKNNIYRIKINDEDSVKKILVDLGISDDGFFLNSGVSREIMEDVCCKRAFIRGLFLGSGSITHPELGYHLEVIFEREDIAEILVQLLESFELHGKVIMRKNIYIVYIKESEQISTFLSIIEAHNALFPLKIPESKRG
jgi:DNA-binding protein WhiA